MYTITRNDFADEISRMIFDMRKKFYEENNWDYILRLVCRLHPDVVNKVNSLNDVLLEKVRETDKKIAIFGASFVGQQMYLLLQAKGLAQKIECFLDSDKQKQGTKLYDKMILAPEELMKMPDEYFVLIPFGRYSDEMERQLADMGFPSRQMQVLCAIPFDAGENIADYENILFDKNNHFVVYREKESLVEDIFLTMLSLTSVKEFEVYECGTLTDEKVRGLIDRGSYCIVLNAGFKKELLDKGVDGSRILTFAPQMDYFQYFDEDVLPKHKRGVKEVFADCGSFDLQTSRRFYEWVDGECEKIYAFECSNTGLAFCERCKKTSQIRDVLQIVPKGLWSEEKSLYFTENENCVTCSRIVDEPTSNKIEVTTIDKVLNGERITFIKMDIEGSELEALKGARESIKKWHPTLAISIYHKPEDIITIPAIIKEIEPEYKMYIRGYHEEHSELVLYAVWDN